ncbi:PIN domain-containing protein [Cylindrospermum stagnale]|nr:PIN domain-containing protein [Cylindrospermum stagnale]
MSIAKGQDLEAQKLLLNPLTSLRIAIPDICYVEAINTYKIVQKNRLQFQADMDKQINESMRDQTSVHAKTFLGHLQQAAIENTSLLNDIQNRLYETINLLLTNAELINLDRTVIQEISNQSLIEIETALIKNDIIDNLILQCILAHANLHPAEKKVFLSGNNNDFGKPEVQEALRKAGINKYFASTKNFIGWLNSQQI